MQNFINILSRGSFLLTAFLVAMNPRHVNVKDFMLPCIIGVLSLQTIFLSNAEKIRDYEVLHKASNFTDFLIFFLMPLAAYWYFSLKKLTQHRQNVQLFASSTEPIDLAWLHRFLLGVALMLLAWVCERFFNLPYLTGLSHKNS